MLFAVIRPISNRQNNHPADLEKAIIKELEGRLGDLALKKMSRFEIPSGGFEQVIEIVNTRKLTLELSFSLEIIQLGS